MFSTSLSFRLRALRLVAASLMAILISSNATYADLLVYDPFGISGGPGDYLVGSENSGVNVLAGQNPVASPTAFYSSPWIQSGGDSQAVTGGSLQYPLFPRAGGHATDAVQFSCCSFGRSGRQIAGGLGGDRGPRTIYQSFLIDFGDQGDDTPEDFGKRGVEWFSGGIGSAFLTVDLYVNHFEPLDDLTLRVKTLSGTQAVPLNGGGLDLDALAGTHLVVMKFEFNPADPLNPLGTAADDDVVSVYLDPTDSIESNWAPAAVVAVNASNLEITHHSAGINFVFSGGDHNPLRFDEVRWGDTFADVTPFVPEPSTLTLVALATLGICGRRRRT
jgi:hypothetical protein